MIKYILTIMAMILCAIAIKGQEAQVQRFYFDPADLEGQVHERLDGNGDRCALIKVQSAIPCEFNGDIVGDVRKVKGSYLVYVCAKDNFTRAIDIIPQGYLPMTVTFADFGINEIKGGQTYILRIETMTPDPSNRAKDEGANYLVLNISPKESATVKIDGMPVTVKDGAVMKFLKYGRHTYSIEAEGYDPLTGEVEITPEGKTVKELALKSLMATLTVLPQTPGCVIEIDGEVKGTGHWTGKLSPGMYRIVCKKQGYRQTAESVELSKSEFKEIKIPELTPSYGNLNVNYTPAGATVEIDGKNMGMTPDVFRDLHAGEHEITVSKQGYTTQRKKITITEGETLELNGGLVEKPKTDNAIVYGYNAVDVKPQFPGGQTELNRWIAQNIKYPVDAIENGIQGRVLVEFVIQEDGSIGRIKIIKGRHPTLDKEAKRVISSLPQFKPGRKYGAPVNVWYSLPVDFRIRNVYAR